MMAQHSTQIQLGYKNLIVPFIQQSSTLTLVFSAFLSNAKVGDIWCNWKGPVLYAECINYAYMYANTRPSDQQPIYRVIWKYTSYILIQLSRSQHIKGWKLPCYFPILCYGDSTNREITCEIAGSAYIVHEVCSNNPGGNATFMVHFISSGCRSTLICGSDQRDKAANAARVNHTTSWKYGRGIITSIILALNWPHP